MRTAQSSSTPSISSPRRARAPKCWWGLVLAARLALLKLARARAGLEGRDFVTPDDVKRIALPALTHRITLRPELWIQRVDPEDVVRDCLDSCPVPSVRVPD